MSSPKSIVEPVPVKATSQQVTPLGTSPAIPNIPPRSTTNSAGPKSFSRSFKSPPPFGTSVSASRTTSKEPTPKPSFDDLGRKASPVAGPGTGQSNLTAQFKSPVESSSGTRDYFDDAVKGGSGFNTPNESGISNAIDLGVTEEEKARVLRRHLVSADERSASAKPSLTPGDTTPVGDHGDSGYFGGGSGGVPADANGSGVVQNTDESFPIPYDAPGGDVTHDLYKWQNEHRARPGRSASFSHVPADRSSIDPSLAHIKEPGGFRRNFISNRAQEQGLEPPPVARNFVDFLFLYGHFAGEDLGEDDDDDDEEDDDEEVDDDGYLDPSSAQNGSYSGGATLSNRQARPLERGMSVLNERAPLLGNRQMSRMSRMSRRGHKRNKSGPPVGTATVTQAVLMLLKGFIGTGILFMGKAFFNGGLIFSTVVMLGIAAISLYAFLLLTKTYLVVPGSFGDIGGELYGKYMRYTILMSITVSQIGFVAAYSIFIAENLQAFILAVTDCKTFIPTRYLIFAELIVFMPLAMIRNLAKLSGTALIADAFILIGLVYIAIQEVTVLSKHGLADVMWFNKESFPLLIGTAVFAFEGIGLVIPITESMREPEKFPPVLSGVMAIVATLFAGFGVLGYAAYGSNIQTVVIVNLPQDDKFVQAVQFLYCIAILLSIPLQLFPAVRIMENGLFSRSGKNNPSVKWQKNVFRAGTVLFCSLLSWAGSSELDKFVSLIGAFACIPLCFIYPPLLHLKACAKTRKEKFIDYTMLTFGILVGVYTTVQTIRSLFVPSAGGPQFGKCKVPKD